MFAEGLHVQRPHAASVGPQDAVLDVVEREQVTAEVVRGAGEELVPAGDKTIIIAKKELACHYG